MGQAQSQPGGAALTPEQLAQRADRRKRIAQELCATEQSYVASMIAVVELYILPLTESCKTNRPILPAADIKKIFSLWQSILEFQSKVFLVEFERRTQEWTPATTIGDVFIKNGDLLRTYVVYVTNYDQSMELLAALPKKNKAFEQFLADVRKSPKHTQIDLSGYLIMPIQRIPRYVLLLTDLIKFTEPTHPDYPVLQEALTKVQKIARDINETKREDENMRKILAIQRNIDGTFEQPLVQPHRRLVRQGELTLTLAEMSAASVKNQVASATSPSASSSSASFGFLSLFSKAATSSNDNPDPNKPVRSGWLIKQGGGMKTWRKRYFVLHYHRLAYYEDEQMTKLKGVFEIDGNCRVLDEKERKEKGYRSQGNDLWIALEVPGRTYLMYHEHKHVEETREWDKALRLVIESAKRIQKRAEDPKQSLGLTVGKTYFVFLFNDLVVYTTSKPKNYNLKGVSYFSSAYKVQRLEGDIIQLQSDQFIVRFKAPTAADADNWATELQKIIDELIREDKVRDDVARSTSPSFWKSLSSFFGT